MSINNPATRESPASDRHSNVRTTVNTRFTFMRDKTKERMSAKRRRRRDDGFHWYEREWESRIWARWMGIRPRAILTVALIAVGSLFVFLIAAHAASRAGLPLPTGRTSKANPIIIQQENGGYTPAPGLPAYTIGVWVSSMSPAPSGSLQVYVRVTMNSSAETNEPVSNIAVNVTSSSGVARGNSARSQGGDVAITDTNGLASFTLFYGAAPGSPVYVYASATIDGHQVTANTVFVPG